MPIEIKKVTLTVIIDGEPGTEIDVLFPPTKFVTDTFTIGKEFSTAWELGTLIEESGMNLIQQAQTDKEKHEAIILIQNGIPTQALYDILPMEIFDREVKYIVKNVVSDQINAKKQKMTQEDGS